MLQAILDWFVGGEMQSKSIESFEKRALVAYEMPVYVSQREDLHIICQDILIARV